MISAPAQSGLIASCANAFGLLTFNEPVATNLVARQVLRSASNTGLSANRNVTGVLNPFQVVLNATGAIARPTDIIADAISRSGSLGTGAATVNDTATLKLDPGIDLANAVTVNAGGTFDASGASIGSLDMNGGTVFVTFGAGALAIDTTADLSGASLAYSGTPPKAPATVIAAAGGVSGKFSSVPDKLSVIYTATTVEIAQRGGTTIVVR
jgi:hypothetical protein